jgi:hypothetical protein
MSVKNIAARIEDGQAVYQFHCEGCGEAGTLGVPLDSHGTFACPEGCGATYVQWKNPEGKYQLTCVVCPVLDDGEPVFEEMLDASEIED